MRKFIRHILIFLAILLVINGIFKIILNDIYFDDYQKVNLKNKIYLLADSHGNALGNFKKEEIYNFSAPSDSYYDMKNKLDYLISHSNIETLLLTVDNHTLSPYRDESNNLDRSAHFTSSSDYSNYLEFIKSKYFYQIFVFLDPQYGALLKTYCISFFKKDRSSNSISWSSITEVSREEASLERFKKQFSFKKSSSNLREELLEIINFCRENDIQLIGIKFPVSKNYIELKNSKNYGSDNIFREKNIPIIEIEDFKYKDNTLFKDQDHLNAKGAKIFKAELWKLLK